MPDKNNEYMKILTGTDIKVSLNGKHLTRVFSGKIGFDTDEIVVVTLVFAPSDIKWVKDKDGKRHLEITVE